MKCDNLSFESYDFLEEVHLVTKRCFPLVKPLPHRVELFWELLRHIVCFRSIFFQVKEKAVTSILNPFPGVIVHRTTPAKFIEKNALWVTALLPFPIAEYARAVDGIWNVLPSHL